jgi:hypothetical protein
MYTVIYGIFVYRGMNNLNELKEIFGNDGRIEIDERVNIETGKVTYGVISSRAFDFYEIDQFQQKGYEANIIGYWDGDLVVELEKKKEMVTQ